MNRLIKILSIITFGAFLFSCSSDKKVEVQPAENINSALELTVMLDGGHSSEVINGETVHQEYGSMKYATSLTYAVHRKDDGLFIKAETIRGDELKKITEGDKALLVSGLPAGSYSVSLICLTKSDFLTDKALALLSLPYSKAVCVVDPKEVVYYNTMEVVLEEDETTKKTAILDKMMGEYVYMFADVDQIPDDAEMQIRVLVKNLPSAFYLHNKQTLTKEEEEELGIARFSHTVEMTQKPTSMVMARYYVLDNENLEDKGIERGTLNIVVSIELPGVGGVKSKIVNKNFPAKTFDFYGVVDEIYSTSQPEERLR